ncbi:MAG: hypothetical protein L0219_07390 [Phycisphaerales bacterium]|nr:hypothetical protein [Phycisphaerales bacterium]
MPERNFNLNIIVSAQDRASTVLSVVGGGVQSMGRLVLDGLALIGAGVGAAAAGLGAFAVSAISSNSAFEQYETQFATLLGSTEAAQQRMAELARFGATTPFDLPGVVEANRILTGFGLTSEDVADRFGFSADEIMTIAGDVASGTGSSFQDMALLFGKFSAGATGEVIARFQEMGIMTREQMAAMGIEFSKSGEMMTPLPEAMEIVLGMMEEKYGGLMDAQSQTFEGMMSNIRDWVSGTIREVGRPIFDKAKEGLARLLEFLSSEFVAKSLEAFAKFASEGVEQAIAVIEELVSVGADLFTDFQQGIDPVEALGNAVGKLFGSSAAARFRQFAGTVKQVFDAVSAVLGPVIQWFAENTKLQDVLLILGIALASVIIPAIWAVIQPVLIALAVFAGLIAIITALRQAWENDFLGIRTALETIWNEGLKPIFDELMLFFQQEGPGALEALRQAWETVLLPAIQRVGEWIKTTLMPILTALIVDYLQNLWVGVKALAEIWETVLWPALQSVWAFIRDNLLPVIIDLVTKGLQFVRDAVDTLTFVWTEYLLPALRDVANFINNNVVPVLQTIGGIFTSVGNIMSSLANIARNVLLIAIRELSEIFDRTIMPVLRDVNNFIDGSLIPAFEQIASTIHVTTKPALEAISGFINTFLMPAFREVNSFVRNSVVGAFNALRDSLSILLSWIKDVFRWLEDMLELLEDVTNALAGVTGGSGAENFDFGGGGDGLPPPSAGAAAMTINNFYLNYGSSQRSDSVANDVDYLQARYGVR